MEQKKKTDKRIEAKKTEDSNFAIAKLVNAPISTKHSVEVANFIRKKELQKTKKLLQEVLDHKKAIPFKRYNRDVGHKAGNIASGRYPEKTILMFLKLLKTAEANAENNGLDTSKLIIAENKADKATQQWHSGRLRRRKMKNTHIYVKLMEKEK